MALSKLFGFVEPRPIALNSGQVFFTKFPDGENIVSVEGRYLVDDANNSLWTGLEREVFVCAEQAILNAKRFLSNGSNGLPSPRSSFSFESIVSVKGLVAEACGVYRRARINTEESLKTFIPYDLFLGKCLSTMHLLPSEVCRKGMAEYVTLSWLGSKWLAGNLAARQLVSSIRPSTGGFDSAMGSNGSLLRTSFHLNGSEKTVNFDFDDSIAVNKTQVTLNGSSTTAEASAPAREWDWALKERCEEAYKLMRAYIPRNIASTTTKEMQEDGVPPAIANRIWVNRILWLICMHPEDLPRIHIGDLRGKFQFHGLDIIEMRALWHCLPPWEGANPKAQWRTDFKRKLDTMAILELQGLLSAGERRHSAYKGYENVIIYDWEAPLARHTELDQELLPIKLLPLHQVPTVPTKSQLSPGLRTPAPTPIANRRVSHTFSVDSIDQEDEFDKMMANKEGWMQKPVVTVIGEHRSEMESTVCSDDSDEVSTALGDVPEKTPNKNSEFDLENVDNNDNNNSNNSASESESEGDDVLETICDGKFTKSGVRVTEGCRTPKKKLSSAKSSQIFKSPPEISIQQQVDDQNPAAVVTSVETEVKQEGNGDLTPITSRHLQRTSDSLNSASSTEQLLQRTRTQQSVHRSGTKRINLKPTPSTSLRKKGTPSQGFGFHDSPFNDFPSWYDNKVNDEHRLPSMSAGISPLLVKEKLRESPLGEPFQNGHDEFGVLLLDDDSDISSEASSTALAKREATQAQLTQEVQEWQTEIDRYRVIEGNSSRNQLGSSNFSIPDSLSRKSSSQQSTPFSSPKPTKRNQSKRLPTESPSKAISKDQVFTSPIAKSEATHAVRKDPEVAISSNNTEENEIDCGVHPVAGSTAMDDTNCNGEIRLGRLSIEGNGNAQPKPKPKLSNNWSTFWESFQARKAPYQKKSRWEQRMTPLELEEDKKLDEIIDNYIVPRELSPRALRKAQLLERVPWVRGENTIANLVVQEEPAAAVVTDVQSSPRTSSISRASSRNSLISADSVSYASENGHALSNKPTPKKKQLRIVVDGDTDVTRSSTQESSHNSPPESLPVSTPSTLGTTSNSDPLQDSMDYMETSSADSSILPSKPMFLSNSSHAAPEFVSFMSSAAESKLTLTGIAIEAEEYRRIRNHIRTFVPFEKRSLVNEDYLSPTTPKFPSRPYSPVSSVDESSNAEDDEDLEEIKLSGAAAAAEANSLLFSEELKDAETDQLQHSLEAHATQLSFINPSNNISVKEAESCEKDKLPFSWADFDLKPPPNGESYTLEELLRLGNYKLIRPLFEAHKLQATPEEATKVLLSCLENLKEIEEPLELLMSLVDCLGANVNAKDSQGLTPLLTLFNNPLLGRFLVTRGADILAEDSNGDSVLQLCLEYGYDWLVPAFESSGRELQLQGDKEKCLKYATILLSYGGYATKVREMIDDGVVIIPPDLALDILEASRSNFESMREPVETFELLEGIILED